jgi:hypothetical protein
MHAFLWHYKYQLPRQDIYAARDLLHGLQCAAAPADQIGGGPAELLPSPAGGCLARSARADDSPRRAASRYAPGRPLVSRGSRRSISC